MKCASYFEYTSAADPSNFMTTASRHVFPSSIHDTPGGPSGVFHLDASAELNLISPATSPNLLASFIRLAGESATIRVSAVATSSVYYVIRGSGVSSTTSSASTSDSGTTTTTTSTSSDSSSTTRSSLSLESCPNARPPSSAGSRSTSFSSSSSCQHYSLSWAEGDVFSLPGGAAEHSSTVDSALIWLCDAPLLSYLNVVPVAGSGLPPALYTAANIAAELAAANAQRGSGTRNRNGVLLGHVALPETRTATATLWALYNLLPAGVVQPPHRHASVAIDYAVKAGPNVYTLMSPTLSSDGLLVNPIRADWVTGAVFTTPPGWWHSHHNDSREDAIVLPLQDAGLYTHMRTLSIEFAKTK